MADAAGRKTGGRQKGTPNKSTREKEAAIAAVADEALRGFSEDQVATLSPRDVLLLVMHSALKMKNLALMMSAAVELMPYFHAKKAPVAERPEDAPTAEEIAADDDPEMAE